MADPARSSLRRTQSACIAAKGNVFETIDEAQAAIDSWAREYNHIGEHQSLWDRPPSSAFASPTGRRSQSRPARLSPSPPRASRAQSARGARRVGLLGFTYQVGRWIAGETVELISHPPPTVVSGSRTVSTTRAGCLASTSPSPAWRHLLPSPRGPLTLAAARVYADHQHMTQIVASKGVNPEVGTLCLRPLVVLRRDLSIDQLATALKEAKACYALIGAQNFRLVTDWNQWATLRKCSALNESARTLMGGTSLFRERCPPSSRSHDDDA